MFAQFEVTSDKLRVPLWTPAIFDRESPIRSNKNVRAVGAFVLDMDHATAAQLDAATNLLERMCVAWCMHTTFAHTDDAPRVRIIIPLDSPVPASDWGEFWKSAVRNFPGCDTQCKDLCRIYFLPSHRKRSPHFYFISKSKELASARLLASSRPKEAFYGGDGTGTTPEDENDSDGLSGDLSRPSKNGVLKLDSQILLPLAAKWQKSTNPSKVMCGRALHAVCKGWKISDVGERDITLFNLCKQLVEEYPSLDPSSSARLFERSLSHWDDGEFSVASIADKFERAIDARSERTHSYVQGKMKEFWLRTPETGRTDGYNSEDLPDLLYVAGLDSDAPTTDLQNKWILQHNTSFWILTKYGYRHFTAYEVDVALQQLLAPALSFRVATTNEAGEPKTVRQMVQQYGQIINGVNVTYLDSVTRFDNLAGVVLEAHAKLKEFRAKKWRCVDDWLRVLAGDDYENLLRWLFCLRDLSQPATALVITGAPSAGKSLLARGVAQLWGSAPTIYADARRQFNAAIKSCPVILAEEHLRKDGMKAADMDDLKMFIQSRSIQIEAKYMPAMQLVGSIRLIAAVQRAESLMGGDDSLNGNDLKAIRERFTVIHATEDAAEFLAEKAFDNGGNLDSWWETKIPEYIHAIWEEEGWERHGRFGVVQHQDAVQIQLLNSAISPMSGAIIEAVISSLTAEDGLIEVWRKQPVLFPRMLKDMWQVYFPNARVPFFRLLVRALEPISLGRISDTSAMKGAVILNTDVLVATARDIGEEDELVAALIKRGVKVR